MAHAVAFVLFALLSAATWSAAVACYRYCVQHPDPLDAPNYRVVRLAAVGLAAAGSFLPFFAGRAAQAAVWAAASYGPLGLPPRRATALFVFLLAGSAFERLVVFALLEVT